MPRFLAYVFESSKALWRKAIRPPFSASVFLEVYGYILATVNFLLNTFFDSAYGRFVRGPHMLALQELVASKRGAIHEAVNGSAGCQFSYENLKSYFLGFSC